MLVAEKDFIKWHPVLRSVSNLEVIMTMTSLKCQGYVEERFVEGHYHWALTTDGLHHISHDPHLVHRRNRFGSRRAAGTFDMLTSYSMIHNTNLTSVSSEKNQVSSNLFGKI